ncbi:MAG: PAS domain S-box protein [Chloroflexi bacterium]|nr:PAS domain S-box protein [Chloroflexota bacterium]
MTNNKREKGTNKLSNWILKNLSLKPLRNSILSKVSVIFVLLAIVPIIIVSIAIAIPSINKGNAALLAQEFNQLEAVRTLKANQIQAWIVDRKGDAVLVSNMVVVKGSEGVVEGLPYLIEYKNDQSNPNFQTAYNRAASVLRPFAEQIGGGVYDDIMMVDPDGDILFAINPNSQNTNIFATGEVDPLLFQNALQNVYIGDVRESPLHGGYLLLVAAPVLGSDGETIGIIILEASADVLNNLMNERTGLGETGETYLVGQDNLFRNDSRFLGHLEVQTTILNPDVRVDTLASRNALSGGYGTEIITDYRGVQVLSSWSPIIVQEPTDSDPEGIHWALIAEIDEAEVLAPNVATSKFVIVLGLSLLAIVGAGAGVFGIQVAKRLVRPIIQLTNRAEEVTSGNLEGTLPSTPRQDEIGVLTNAFSTMTRRLQISIESLQKSEERYRGVSELATTFAYALKYDTAGKGHLKWFTGNLDGMTGYTEEELKLRGFDGILHPDEVEAGDKRDQQVKAGKSTTAEFRIITKDKGIRWMLGYTRPMWGDVHKKVVGAIGAALDITERKNAEQSLRLLSSAVEQTASKIIITNTDGLIEYVNPAFEILSGYSKEEAIGKKMNLLKSGEQDDIFYQNLWETILKGETFQADFINKRKNGEIFHDSQTITPIKDGQGNITHFVSTSIDITERKLAEEGLRKKSAEFEGIIKAMTDVVVYADGDRKILVTNPALEKVFGYTSEEVLGKHTSMFYTSREEFERQGKLRFNLSGEEILKPYEIDYRRKDGSIFPSETVGTPVKDSNGEIVGLLGIIRDITEHKNREETLRLLSSAVEQTGSHVLISNTKGEIEYVNPAFEQATGYSKEEAIGLKPNILKSDAHDKNFYKNLWDTILAGEDFHEEIINQKKNGEIFHETKTITPIKDEEGRITHFVATGIDITDRIAAENMLVNYNQRLETLRDIDRAILSAQTPQAIAQAATIHLKELIPFSRTSVIIYDYENKEVEVLFEHWDQEGTIINDGSGRYSMEIAPINPLLSEGRIYEVEDLTKLKNPTPVEQAILKRGLKSYIQVPLVTRYGLLGALNFVADDPNVFNTEHKEIAREAANSIAIALQQARLFQQIDAGREQLQILARELVNVQETERRRLALELHDEIGQILTGLKFTLEMGLQWPDKIDYTSLAESQKLVDDLIARVQEISLDLRPAMLDDLGLLPALLWHFDRYKTQTGVDVEFEHAGLKQRFDSQLETVAYRIVQEGLTNVARYAEVKKVAVQVTNTENLLTIQLHDDGVGFDLDTVLASGESSGLVGIRERTLTVGGQLIIETEPGAGSLLIAKLPIQELLERRETPRKKAKKKPGRNKK